MKTKGLCRQRREMFKWHAGDGKGCILQRVAAELRASLHVVDTPCGEFV